MEPLGHLVAGIIGTCIGESVAGIGDPGLCRCTCGAVGAGTVGAVGAVGVGGGSLTTAYLTIGVGVCAIDGWGKGVASSGWSDIGVRLNGEVGFLRWLTHCRYIDLLPSCHRVQ